jgi:serine/threonine protein kinase
MGGICTKSPVILETIKDRNKTTTSLLINNNTLKSTLNNNMNDYKPSKDDDYLTQLSSTKHQAQTKNTFQLDDIEFVKGTCIGQGIMSNVYSGLSMKTGILVAIKTVKLKLTKNEPEKMSKEIIKAVENISKLEHKNIIKYLTTQITPEKSDEIDIILEYCNGGSIKQILEKFDVFDEKLIRTYVKQKLEGLVYLHEQGIIHRNITNNNILVDGDGIIKINDFLLGNILIGDDPEAIIFYNTDNGKSKYF